jgi:exonuclease III
MPRFSFITINIPYLIHLLLNISPTTTNTGIMIYEPHENRETQTHIRTTKHTNNKEITRILTQDVRGLPSENDTKLKSIIHQMKSKNWDAACLQETWRLEKDDFYIDGYHVFLQGSSTKINKHGRIMGGVAIILSPEFDNAHKEDKGKNICLPKPFDGRMLAIPLTFKNKGNNGKRIKGSTKLLLCSIYHSVDNDEYECFDTELAMTLDNVPSDRSIYDIMHVGTNAGSGHIHKETLGRYGIKNRNKKGTSLLNLLASLEMKITNSFFQKRASSSSPTTTHTTWRNTNASKSQHVLDVFSISSNIFKRVRKCHTTRDSVDSDHTAVIIKLELTSISFKMQENNHPNNIQTTDWELINTNDETKARYNETLEQYTQTSAHNPPKV